MDKYNITINKEFKYIKAYTIVKKVSDNSNFISRKIAELVDKYVLNTKKIS